MGCFDYVEFKMECPNCKAEVTGFQSKDGMCCFEHVTPNDVNNFYTSCDNCKTWIEVQRKEGIGEKRATIEDAVVLLERVLSSVPLDAQLINNINGFLAKNSNKTVLEDFVVTCTKLAAP